MENTVTVTTFGVRLTTTWQKRRAVDQSHGMRHSFASICASKGIDIYHIATWLGDDVRVVQRHLCQTTARRP